MMAFFKILSFFFKILICSSLLIVLSRTKKQGARDEVSKAESDLIMYTSPLSKSFRADAPYVNAGSHCEAQKAYKIAWAGGLRYIDKCRSLTAGAVCENRVIGVRRG